VNMQGQEDFVKSKDHAEIVKGKRTKRQRPSPSQPYSSSLTCTSSSGSISSATNVDVDVYESTEEEEDMANCLILLAQGGRPMERFHSRKLSEMAGFYVYECKTCSRTFPSFQALGGHRASHKRPRAAMAMVELQKKATATPPPRECLEEAQFKAKIHECSVCGLEFMSGQALGGHMRRHRAASTSTTVDSQHVEIKPRDILSLDLNLPAPEDDSKFPFTSAAQQTLVFSAPALVDCHY
jgi:hypothetical protein